MHDTVSTFPVGSEYVKVFVSALNNPSSFHVQLITENASALETMNAELTKEVGYSVHNYLFCKTSRDKVTCL